MIDNTMTALHLDVRPGRELGRFVRSLATTRGDLLAAEAFSHARGWTSTTAVCKALVAPLTQADADGALLPVVNDLAAVLRPATVVGRMIGLHRVPFNCRLLTQNVGGSGAFVEEGLPIPVSAFDLSAMTTLRPKKCAGIRVLTQELISNATAGTDQLIANDAAGGVAQALDVAFLDPANSGTAGKPASITSGAQEYSSAGSSVAAIDSDIARMLAVLTGANCSLATAVWIMGPTTATYLSLLRGTAGPSYPQMTARGGSLLGLPVLTSTNVAATGSPGERFIALVEASEIAIADDGTGEIEISSRASLQMDDAPAAGATNEISLWQHSLVGVKCTRFVNWQRRRDGAVAVLRNVIF